MKYNLFMHLKFLVFTVKLLLSALKEKIFNLYRYFINYYRITKTDPPLEIWLREDPKRREEKHEAETVLANLVDSPYAYGTKPRLNLDSIKNFFEGHEFNSVVDLGGGNGAFLNDIASLLSIKERHLVDNFGGLKQYIHEKYAGEMKFHESDVLEYLRRNDNFGLIVTHNFLWHRRHDYLKLILDEILKKSQGYLLIERHRFSVLGDLHDLKKGYRTYYGPAVSYDYHSTKMDKNKWRNDIFQCDFSPMPWNAVIMGKRLKLPRKNE